NGRSAQSHCRQSGVEVLCALNQRPARQAQLTSQTREERALVAQFQTGQQILITNEDQSKGRLLRKVQAQQQAHFLQCRLAVILGFIQNQHQDAPVQLLERLLDAAQVFFAAIGALLAQLGCQRRQDGRAAQSGLSQADRKEQPLVQAAHPATD